MLVAAAYGAEEGASALVWGAAAQCHLHCSPGRLGGSGLS